MASRVPSSPPSRPQYLSRRQTEAYLLARDLVRRVRQAASAAATRQGGGLGPVRREQG